METKEVKLAPGMPTNKGVVKTVDNDWVHKDGTPADVLVITDQGAFRKSEVELLTKPDEPKPRQVKDPITFDDAMKLDIRVGEVLDADRVKGTDKLIMMKVRTEIGEKQVVTNLGSHYELVDLIGMKFLFIMNLEPVKVREVLSEAMIIASDSTKYVAKTNRYENRPVIIPVRLPLTSVIL